ncbi:MAG: hypothetical protein ABSA42_17725 [Terracidiphilus sp.]|jgi:hypothetical protein
MKTARFFAMAFLAAASIPVMAQEAGAQEAGGDGSQKAVYAPQGPMGFGDASASHSWEMSSITGELQGKLDSKTAKVGDRVVLKTIEKVQTADGTVIPGGTRLVGHITQVQTRDSAHAISQMGIAFDRAELKNGQSIAIYTLIRGATPNSGVMAMNSMNGGGPMPMSGMGDSSSGGAMTGGRGGHSGGEQPGSLGGGVQRTSPTTPSAGDPVGANPDLNPQGAVQLAGHGDVNENVGAHQLAAARAVPHATAIPGVMLAGNSSASGVFSATMKDIQFEIGTQMQLGIVADR